MLTSHCPPRLQPKPFASPNSEEIHSISSADTSNRQQKDTSTLPTDQRGVFPTSTLHALGDSACASVPPPPLYLLAAQCPGATSRPTHWPKASTRTSHWLISFKNRCYKCLDTDHSRAHCRNPIKCRLCLGIGHSSSNCITKHKSASAMSNTTRLLFHDTLRHHHPFYRLTNQNLLPPNSSRRPHLDVHLPALDERPTNAVAILVISPPPANPHTWIRQVLLDRFQIPNVGFAPCAPSLGSGFVFFLSTELMEHMIARGSFIHDDHWVKFCRHDRGTNHHIAPLQYRACIALEGFPITYWRRSFINQAVASFATVIAIEPSSLQGRDFSSVILMVLVDNLSDIPVTLIVHDPCFNAFEVGVRILDWWNLLYAPPTPTDYPAAFRAFYPFPPPAPLPSYLSPANQIPAFST